MSAVAAYSAAIARAASVTGAELVRLDAVVQAALAAGTDSALVGAHGFHPSTAGHQAVAGTFAAVLKRPPA